MLADAEGLSALSGMTGAVGESEGEEFSAFGGNVTGGQIELVPGKRIVQAWRFPAWEPGRYSIVRFSLAAVDGGTRLVIRSARRTDRLARPHRRQLADVLPVAAGGSFLGAERMTAEAALLDRARSGDGGAFAELVEPHRRELHVHC